MKNLFSSLQHRNFRLYLIGQSVSLTGSWMQQIAIGWLLYRLTNSTSSLGWLGFCGQIPVALLMTGAGILVDRCDRRHLLLILQSLALGQALVLAILVWSHVITPRHILLLTIFGGIIESIALPARQSLIPALLGGTENLGNAIGLNQTMVNATRFLGPMIAGWLVTVSGEASCFLINSLSFLAMIAALMMIRLSPRTESRPKVDFWSHWKEGLWFAYSHPAIREILEMMIVSSLMATPCMILTPAVVRELGAGPVLLGALGAASGGGAIVGGLAMTMMRITIEGDVRRLVTLSGITLAISTILFSWTRSIPAALCLFVVSGFSYTLMNVASNTWLQLTVPDVKRGRLMSLFFWCLLGVMPVASLLTGLIANRLGVYPTILLAGCLGLAAILAIVLSSRRNATPIEGNAFERKNA